MFVYIDSVCDLIFVSRPKKKTITKLFDTEKSKYNDNDCFQKLQWKTPIIIYNDYSNRAETQRTNKFETNNNETNEIIKKKKIGRKLEKK